MLREQRIGRDASETTFWCRQLRSVMFDGSASRNPSHYPIESGSEIVEDICGSVRTRCAIALGHWNVDAGVMGGPFNSWERLVGGNPPVFVVPNSETCCHPSTCCRFDHLATNIPGVFPVHVKVWEYQLLDQFRMDEEHMPVTVHFTVPQDVGQV